MLEFRRFLSYIYSYRDSVKQKNTGFAKVEARGEVLRVQVHIKGMYLNGIENCQVYGFYRQDHRMYGVLLGEFFLRNGSGDMAVVTERNHISGTEIALEQLGGLYIVMRETPGVVMASAWDNDPVEPWSFAVYPKEKKASEEEIEKRYSDTQPSKNNIEAASTQPKEEVATEKNLAQVADAEVPVRITDTEEATLKEAVLEEVPGKIADAEVPVRITDTEEAALKEVPMDTAKEQEAASEEVSVEIVKAESSGQKECPQPVSEENVQKSVEEESEETEDATSDGVESATKRKSDSGESGDIREQSAICGEVIPFVDKHRKSDSKCGQKILWHKIMRKYPVVHPFEHRQELELVRIEPKDLSILAKPYWALGNNSFLLHGYCSYRYLILGRNPQNSSFFLGIPGIFHPREKLLANMFGFSEFYTSRNVRVSQGEFGYYVREVELPEEDCSPRI